VVGVAKRVAASILSIGTPAVMNRPTSEPCQDPDTLQSRFSPLGMALVVGEVGSAGDMQPVEDAPDALACLVEMGQVGALEGGDDRLLHGSQGRCGLLCGREESAFRERSRKQVFHEGHDPLIGKELELLQVGGEGFDARTILHRMGRLFGEGSWIDCAAVRTGAGLCLVLGDHEFERRQIKDLMRLGRLWEDFCQGSTTLLADLTTMHHDGIRIIHPLQGVSGMSFLSSGRASALGALGLGLGFVKAVGGGRFTGVVAVLSETVFELFDALGEEVDAVLERGNNRDDRVGALVVECLDLFLREHIRHYEAGCSKIAD